jgi:hypothetical protein
VGSFEGSQVVKCLFAILSHAKSSALFLARLPISGVKRVMEFTWEKKMEVFERVLIKSGG